MQFTVFFKSILTCMFFYMCSSTPSQGKEKLLIVSDTSKKEQMSFKQVIDMIEKKVVDLTAATDLLQVKEFIDLLESPNKYIKDAVKLLSDDSSSIQQKMIAAYSMQKLPLTEYIAFLKDVTELYLNEIFEDDYLLIIIIAADFSSDCPVIKNYTNEDVVLTLGKIKNNKRTTDNLKIWIDRILSGKAWKKKQNI